MENSANLSITNYKGYDFISNLFSGGSFTLKGDPILNIK